MRLGGLDGKYLEYGPGSDIGCPLGDAWIEHLAPLVCDAGCTGLGSRDLGFEFPVAGVKTRAWVLDAGGRLRVVIETTSTPDATPAELDELHAVLDSLHVVRTAPATPAPQPPAG